MNTRRNRLTAAITLGASGLLAAGALALPAAAQETDTGSDTAIVQSEDGETTRADRRAARAADFAERLADELDLDVDTVTEAMVTVREAQKADRMAALIERLDAKLAAGEITQEQYDEKLAAIESGEFPGRRGNRGPRGGGGAPAADTTAA